MAGESETHRTAGGGAAWRGEGREESVAWPVSRRLTAQRAAEPLGEERGERSALRGW